MKVKIFLGSANNKRFADILRAFAVGISKYDSVEIIEGNKYSVCDCAVFFGSWKDRDQPHHNLKRDIVRKAPQFVVLETPLLGRGRVEEYMKDDWYRIGLNGFLNNTGNFNNKNRPADRWNKISTELNLQFDGWRSNNSKDDPYLVALQLPGDASLQGANITEWCYRAIKSIRSYGNKPIILRTPQLKRQFDSHYWDQIFKIPEVTLQEGTRENLFTSLRNSYCSVAYSSGLGIDSILAGTPTIAGSPASFAWPLTSSLSVLNRPSVHQWLNDLSYCQWSSEEIYEGFPWVHLRKVMKYA